jgi:hypothetical protein
MLLASFCSRKSLSWSCAYESSKVSQVALFELMMTRSRRQLSRCRSSSGRNWLRPIISMAEKRTSAPSRLDPMAVGSPAATAESSAARSTGTKSRTSDRWSPAARVGPGKSQPCPVRLNVADHVHLVMEVEVFAHGIGTGAVVQAHEVSVGDDRAGMVADGVEADVAPAAAVGVYGAVGALVIDLAELKGTRSVRPAAPATGCRMQSTRGRSVHSSRKTRAVSATRVASPK